MFVENKVTPAGCNPIGEEGRMPVARVVSGDSWEIRAEIAAADGSPATPSNSFVEFVVAENQFSPAMWTGTWNSGVLPYENRPGFVVVTIPRDVTKTFRRGSYQFSLRVADRMRSHFMTQLNGHFLVEYMPTSDQHSIPYRDGTSEIFSSGGSAGGKESSSGTSGSGSTSGGTNCSCSTEKLQDTIQKAIEKAFAEKAKNVYLPDQNGEYHEVRLVKDEDTGMVMISVEQDAKEE